MSLFGTIFYGGGSFYGTGSNDVPQDLRFYRTDTDGVYVFHWGFKEIFITPILASADFDLEIDSDPAFPSPTVFDSSNVINFQNGDVRKGFAVNVADRLDKVEQTFFARVKTKIGFNSSTFSEILEFIIPQKFEVETAENILLNTLYIRRILVSVVVYN